MPRKLQIWNGRGDYDKLDGHLFVAAYTKKQAVELMNKAGYSCGRFNLRELNVYFNEGCWGRDMNGIEPTPGVWHQSKKNALKLCPCKIELFQFDRAHNAGCPRIPKRLI